MSTFVLVHGSWHDGSAWEPVINHLEAGGHQAFAPTIAGHGKGVNKNVNHAQCTQSIIDPQWLGKLCLDLSDHFSNPLHRAARGSNLTNRFALFICE